MEQRWKKVDLEIKAADNKVLPKVGLNGIYLAFVQGQHSFFN